MKGHKMTIRVLVMSDRSDEYTGKKGVVRQQVITVMDQTDTGERLAQPIEYAIFQSFLTLRLPCLDAR
jgi:hypothetical protein